MSSEERKPKSTLPMPEAIGCEIFMVIYVFHIICLDTQLLSLLFKSLLASIIILRTSSGIRFCRTAAWHNNLTEICASFHHKTLAPHQISTQPSFMLSPSLNLLLLISILETEFKGAICRPLVKEITENSSKMSYISSTLPLQVT